MENTYYLEISVDDRETEMIDQILGVKHNTNNWWQFQIEEKEENIDYIDFFLNILEGKYEALEKIGITRDMISIWRLYEYDRICEMKFEPPRLKRMGENNIKLCISCYEGDETYDYDSGYKKILN